MLFRSWTSLRLSLLCRCSSAPLCLAWPGLITSRDGLPAFEPSLPLHRKTLLAALSQKTNALACCCLLLDGCVLAHYPIPSHIPVRSRSQTLGLDQPVSHWHLHPYASSSEYIYYSHYSPSRQRPLDSAIRSPSTPGFRDLIVQSVVFAVPATFASPWQRRCCLLLPFHAPLLREGNALSTPRD